jgi:hypothetical protein
MKKIVIAAVVLCLAAAGAFAWQMTSATEVGVSKVANNPAEFVGKVKVIGKAGRIDPGRGLVEIVDDKACCQLVIAVPTTAQQQAELGVERLYTGMFPQPGQPLEAHGVIRQLEGGYRLDVSKVTSAGAVLLRRL